ncbi:MAG: RNA polymerase sigma factor [Ferruginibacter sp.]
MKPAVLPQRDELVERCKNGDTRAYRELYERFARAMFNTCLRIVNNVTEAEDILQESFTEAFRQLNSYQYRTSFGGWLKQICVNRSINQLKKRRISWVPLGESAPDNADSPDTAGEEDIVFQAAKIREAIMLLPDGYRTVLSLYLLEGYDHEEIAEILEISESTSRTQYMRAKQKLLQLIKQEL